jgi:hypothetical protein
MLNLICALPPTLLVGWILHTTCVEFQKIAHLLQ